MNFKDQLIIERCRGQEEALIRAYIDNGPAFLKKGLDLTEKEWKTIFDYLVFDHNLLIKTVNASLKFFVGEFTKYGASHVRGILEIQDEAYDLAWSEIMKLLFDAYCQNNFAELTFERSLNVFVHIINCGRVHRMPSKMFDNR